MCPRWRDHPRMRGEHRFESVSSLHEWGSSPHARGTLLGLSCGVSLEGIIPACAGNTGLCEVGCYDEWGSSPHARGTRGDVSACRLPPGIIPACAGNTGRRRPVRWLRRDHPRMRGEHDVEVVVLVHFRGSSPHARGTRWSFCFSFHCLGIIPACAGNTRRGRCTCCRWRDHPRMRGEHISRGRPCLVTNGSSPHARGTLGGAPHVVVIVGIIPACAGNTQCRVGIWRNRGDHPRMRGEHGRRVYVPVLPAGSSPHARGTLPSTGYCPLGMGIIPACAGNTSGRAYKTTR